MPNPLDSIVAVCADGGLLCRECRAENEALIADADADCPDDDQWRIIGEQRAEHDNECSHCYCRYADDAGRWV